MALALGPSPRGRGENLKNELESNKERGKKKQKQKQTHQPDKVFPTQCFRENFLSSHWIQWHDATFSHIYYKPYYEFN